jgi:hypothetical protein
MAHGRQVAGHCVHDHDASATLDNINNETKLTLHRREEMMMLLHHRGGSSQPPYPRRKILSLFSIGFFLGVTFFSHQIENNLLDHQLHHAARNNNALRSSDAVAKKVSYVTSFWAKERHTTTNVIPHRREIEAALLANIYNPHIDQVVVFLDGVTTDDDTIDEEHKSTCVHFHQDMAELSRQFLQMSSSSTENTHHGVIDDPMFKVTCVNVITGQPTYHQMFLNAISDVVTGDIVIMANADMVFDDTIAKARKLKEDVLLVLGTRGFSARTPISTRQFYDIIARTAVAAAGTTENEQKLIDWDIDQCRTNHWSWDTWIFHKNPNLQGQLQEEHFQRRSINNEMAPFYMNENGAENAALWAMEQCPSFATTYNACDEIQSWSFHLTPKTHHSHSQGQIWPRGANMVPKPWGGSENKWKSRPYPPKSCVRENGCFFD